MMCMGQRISFAFVFLASLAWAQSDWRKVCADATSAPLTVPENGGDLRKCDSTALYYGFDRPPDWKAALECAYYQRAHPHPNQADPFAGPGVLTMLYANGLGVPRNYDLAIRFACENTWAAEAEMQGRIAHLEKLRDGHADAKDFDLCDDATSGLMAGECEWVQQQFLNARRRKEMDAISVNWPPPIKQAFKSLEAAEEAFVQASGYHEVDLSGSARAAFSLEEQGRLRDQFLATIQRFAAGQATSDYQNADRSLNDAYQRIQQAPDSFWQWGTVKPSGIRDTERLWIQLRDAWVEFARQAFPRLSADAVRTEITRQRTAQLEGFLK